MATWLPRKRFLLILVLLTASAQTSPSVFQCQFSQPSGFLYTPNIPDSYFNYKNYGNNVTEPHYGITYIFTLPSESVQRNCSGRVESIQYCYQARNRNIGQTINVFNFLSLVQEPVQGGVQFTVNRSITIQTTPEYSICSDPPGMRQQICCDTTFLSATDQFQIPPSTYTFGVVIINNNVKLLAFTNTVTEYYAEQYQAALGSFSPGAMFTLTENDQVYGSLLLLRFSIVPMTTTTEMDTEPVTTTELVTNAPTVTEPATTAEPVTIVTEPATTAELVTNAPTVTEPVTTTEPITNSTDEPATTAELVTNVVNHAAEPGSVISGIVAGVVGLTILVTSLVIVVLSIAFIRRKSAKSNITFPTRDLSATDEDKNTLSINMHGNDAYACTSPIQTSTNESYVTSVPLFPNKAYASVDMEERMDTSIDERGNNQTYASINIEKETYDYVDVGGDSFNMHHTPHTPVTGI